MSLGQTIPALPVRDAAGAVAFYRDRLGFETLHHDGGFAVLGRDDAVLHLWEASDESWREREPLDRPVCSGAESFIAGTASCRISVDGVDELYEELRASDVLHPVSKDGVSTTDFGTREFATLDGDGNLVTFFEWVSGDPAGANQLRQHGALFFGLDADVDEVSGVPTELNRRLVAGEIDLAPISSIAYARDAQTLRVLPQVAVSSEGAVDSIQLVSRAPLARVRTIAVTPESATSVVLTRILVPEAEHVALEEEADATLLIGDAALQSMFEDPTPHYDLGRLWRERTGLPMVYAALRLPGSAA